MQKQLFWRLPKNFKAIFALGKGKQSILVNSYALSMEMYKQSWRATLPWDIGCNGIGELPSWIPGDGSARRYHLDNAPILLSSMTH